MSPEQRAKISRALKGRPKPPRSIEHGRAISRALQRPLETLGYSAIHVRANRLLPRVCSSCGTTVGQLDVALLHGRGTKIDQSGRGEYSADPTDYIRLCASCHKTYDGTVQNLYRRTA